MKLRRPSLWQAARAWGNALRHPVRGLNGAVATTLAAIGFPGGGGYAVLDPRRKMISGLSRMLAAYSANELANLSLPQLRSLCRKLERDNSTARAAVEGSVADVVGSGIALEPDTGNPDYDQRIKAVWDPYVEGCDITGTRSLYDLQQEAFRSWFAAGEHVWRTPVLVERADVGLIPVVVLALESEWIATDLPDATGEQITRAAGLDLDAWGRTVAYWLRNPEAMIGGSAERVPAAQMIHGFEHRRPLQNRGEPMLTPVIERIHQEGDLIDTELKAAINCSGLAVVVTSAYHEPADTGTDPNQQTDGTEIDPAIGIAVGSTVRMDPGDEVEAFKHDRPGQQIKEFVDLLRSGVAAACRVSKRWLTRTYDQSWSSQRADAQDSERLLAGLREKLGRTTAGALYLRAWPYLCAKAGVPVTAGKGYRLLPDGQPYVNPVDDIKAICMAVSAGLTTWDDEIAKRGKDRSRVWHQLAKEYREAAALGLKLDLSGTNAPAPESTIGDDGDGDQAKAKDTAAKKAA